MYKAILSLIVFCTVGVSAYTQEPARRRKPFSHSLQTSHQYFHVSDPIWQHIWWRRWVPAYEAGYKDRVFLRFSTARLARYRKGYLPPGWPDNLPSHWDYEYGDVESRSYRYYDGLVSYGKAFGKHLPKIGVGATYRKGSEVLYEGILPPWWYDDEPPMRVPRDEWGLLLGASYSYNFWKWFLIGAEANYRIYTDGDPLFTGGITLSARLRHK